MYDYDNRIFSPINRSWTVSFIPNKLYKHMCLKQGTAKLHA